MSATLARLHEYVVAHPAGFEPSEDVDELASQLPPPLQALVKATLGCEIDFAGTPTILLAIDDVLDLMEQGHLQQELPGVVAFASDGAELYVLDVEGITLGAGEVWSVIKDDISSENCQEAAKNLDEFIAGLLNQN